MTLSTNPNLKKNTIINSKHSNILKIKWTYVLFSKKIYFYLVMNLQPKNYYYWIQRYILMKTFTLLAHMKIHPLWANSRITFYSSIFCQTCGKQATTVPQRAMERRVELCTFKIRADQGPERATSVCTASIKFTPTMSLQAAPFI